MSEEKDKDPDYYGKAFITLLKHGDDYIFRIWIDKKGVAYKVEIRTPHYQGYLNPEEFLKKFTGLLK